MNYNKLQVSIDQKLQEDCIEKGKSILDKHILYHYHIIEISKLFYEPQQHYSKIMVLAYKKAIK